MDEFGAAAPNTEDHKQFGHAFKGSFLFHYFILFYFVLIPLSLRCYYFLTRFFWRFFLYSYNNRFVLVPRSLIQFVHVDLVLLRSLITKKKTGKLNYLLCISSSVFFNTSTSQQQNEFS